MTPFTHFLAIDWSGARNDSGRGLDGLALAMCRTGASPPILLQCAGGWSRQAVAQFILALARRGVCALIGIDAAFSLPFCDKGAFFPGGPNSPHNAPALWADIAGVCTSDPDLGAASYIDWRRQHFWMGKADGPRATLARLRETERVCPGQPASPFILMGASQVGKASLTAMHLLHHLHLSDGRLSVWPFDPCPETGPCLVEIYCRLFTERGGVRGKIRDRASLNAALAHWGSAPMSAPMGAAPALRDHDSDALVSAAALRALADDPAVWTPPAMSATIAAAEGWTFGVI